MLASKPFTLICDLICIHTSVGGARVNEKNENDIINDNANNADIWYT